MNIVVICKNTVVIEKCKFMRLYDGCVSGSGGRIAIYASSTYTFSGTIQAFGGTGPTTSSVGSAGTIYIQTLKGSSIYKKLIVSNGGQTTAVGQYTAFTVPGITSYSFDMLVLSGSALVNLKPDPTSPSTPIFVTINDMSGDLTATLTLMANVNVTLRSQTSPDNTFLDGVSNSFMLSSSNSVQLAQSTAVTEAHANITTVNVALQANSNLILPSLLYVCNTSFTSAGTLQNVRTVVFCNNYASPGSYGIVGCKTPGFSNFNPQANFSGPCINYATVLGCMNPAAVNYNSSATVDDGSCRFWSSGCTISAATNYDATATLDDGSCIIASPSNITCPPPLNQSCSSSTSCVDGISWSATGVSPCNQCTSCSASNLGTQLAPCTKYRDASCLYQIPCTPGTNWSPSGL